MNKLQTENGPQFTSIATQLLTTAVQKGSDVMVFQIIDEKYTVLFQRRTAFEIYSSNIIDTQKLMTVAKVLENLIDSRQSPIPIVRQGKVRLKLNGREWHVEIVSVPTLGVGPQHESSGKPTVTVFFSEIKER